MNIAPKDINNTAIVVVGYNRKNSLINLFDSLMKADYTGYDVPLVISIDASGDEDLYSYVKGIKWEYGNKYVNIESNRLGLKQHIFKCGDLTEFFKAIILLEDDLYVAPDFYRYVDKAIEVYGENEKIAQIALYRNENHGYAGLPIYIVNNGYDVFAKQEPTTWGECWNKRMWSGFKSWLDSWEEDFDPVDIHYRSKRHQRAWGKYFDAYMWINDMYSIAPYISLSTNCGDAGEHSLEGTTDFQVELQLGHREYNMPVFNDLVKYDTYHNYIGLKDYLEVPKDDVCLDLFGDNPNLKNKRYLLSISKKPYRIIKSYGLMLRPIELNVIYSITGRGIYLYDTSQRVEMSHSKYDNITLTKYYLRSFSIPRIKNYVKYVNKMSFLRKVNKLFGLLKIRNK